MKLDIYVIRGRGEIGDKFQLAIVKNIDGDYYQGEYDLAAQYSNMDELKDMLAKMVNVDKEALELSEIDM
jgi:hypothetical protein